MLRDKYVHGVEELDRRSRDRFGTDFVSLDAKQQDSVLTDLARPGLDLGSAEVVAGFAPVETPLQQTSVEIDLDFLPLLALHTRQGFYADPIYGGNRDMVGWKLIGFPGARYDHSAFVERHGERYPLPPVGLKGRAEWTKAKS